MTRMTKKLNRKKNSPGPKRGTPRVVKPPDPTPEEIEAMCEELRAKRPVPARTTQEKHHVYVETQIINTCDWNLHGLSETW